MWITTWSNSARWRSRLADRGPAGGEALVTGMPGLAEEGLEAAQPVGRAVVGAGVGVCHLELEVLAEVAQPAEHGGLGQRGRAPGQPGRQLSDLPGGQEVGPGTQHPEHRVVHVRAVSRARAPTRSRSRSRSRALVRRDRRARVLQLTPYGRTH